MKTLPAAICLALCASTGAMAEGVSVDLDAAYVSTYVWRGLALTDGPTFQPGVTASFEGLSFNIWANLDLDDVNGNEGEVNELDYTLDYTFEAGPAEVSLGFIRYTFPNTAFGMTSELYVGASFDVPASPSIALYQDIDAVEGMYGVIGASHGFALPADASLDLGLSIAFGSEDYNTAYYAGSGSGATDLLFSVEYGLPLNDSTDVGVLLAYSTLLGDAEDAVNTDPYGVFGISYSASF